MKIQERMAIHTNMCLNWRNISFYQRNVKNKYVFQFLDVYTVNVKVLRQLDHTKLTLLQKY